MIELFCFRAIHYGSDCAQLWYYDSGLEASDVQNAILDLHHDRTTKAQSFSSLTEYDRSLQYAKLARTQEEHKLVGTKQGCIL